VNERQQAHALLSAYKSLYANKYSRQALLHTYSLIHGFTDAVRDLGYANAKKALEYYFTCDNFGHTPENFLRKYVDLHKMREEVEKDRIKRAKILAETAERVKRMEERNGDNAGTAD
jgi:hypothetical protein